MKRRNIKERRSTLLSVAAVAGLQLLYLAVWIWALPLLAETPLEALLVLVLIVCNVVTVVGLFAALRQRLDEWKGGEEHDAGQY